MHSDPIADMLTRIRNATRAQKQRVDIPRSNVKVELAQILKQEGYIDDHRVIANVSGGQGMIEIKLRYDKDNVSVIDDLQRVSKPGLRKYIKSSDIPKVQNGLGIMVMSTSRGLMTDRAARAAKVGGEAICAVW